MREMAVLSLFSYHGYLIDNKIGDVGAQALSNSLKTNSTLLVLYLGGLQILFHLGQR